MISMLRVNEKSPLNELVIKHEIDDTIPITVVCMKLRKKATRKSR